MKIRAAKNCKIFTSFARELKIKFLVITQNCILNCIRWTVYIYELLKFMIQFLVINFWIFLLPRRRKNNLEKSTPGEKFHIGYSNMRSKDEAIGKTFPCGSSSKLYRFIKERYSWKILENTTKSGKASRNTRHGVSSLRVKTQVVNDIGIKERARRELRCRQ